MLPRILPSLRPFAALCLLASAGTAETALFPEPEAAVQALAQAVRTTNHADLGALLGPAATDLVRADSVQGIHDLAEFAAAFAQSNRLQRVTDAHAVLEIGPHRWPFPVPLIRAGGGWQFDGAAGLEELLNRRIGHNELEVLAVLRACVEAQREYASQDRDGDGVLEFAQTLSSQPGRTDGLYWSPAVNGELSPLGPLVAQAQAEGYFKSGPETGSGPAPFHGYYFKILRQQGKHAPGGRHDYVINGNMVAGFAVVAWPAEHGESGIMTFLVNQQGRIHQRDLGPGTAKAVRAMKAYDPGPAWETVRD
ncbi:MAG: hypothetical protein RJA22_2543 [Verrucomicrobiota bacterium]